LHVGPRLAVAFGLVLALLGLVVLVGVRAASSASKDAAALAEAVTLTGDVGQLKYRAADFNGWQTAYALDVARKSQGAVDDAAGGSRTLFLTSAKAFEQELAVIGEHPLSDEQRASLTETADIFAQFMDLDVVIVELYRTGTLTTIAQGDDLVLGKAIELFDAVALGAEELRVSVQEESEAAEEQAAADAVSARAQLLAVGLVALACGMVLALLLTRSIVRPLRRVSGVLEQLADGDLTGDAAVVSSDELGQMAAALTRAQASMRITIETMAGNAAALSGASVELSANTSQIAATAQETATQAITLSSSAEQVSNNVQTVAAGAEQMSASILEISQNAAHAVRVAASAVDAATDINASMSTLGESSQEIGAVIKAITSIAQQTNLLALNATIEAARAGEAGRGFAVVANEVKELAQETARATEDISQRIASIQAGTMGAADAIGRISSIIEQISDFQTTIASAVEEQTATTNEMTRSIAEAAAGSSHIASSISGLADAAALTTSGVEEARQATADLARMSTELKRGVDGFRY